MMKAPKYAVASKQQMLDVGLNAFAVDLLAESYGDKPERFKGETLALLAHDHAGREVWIIIGRDRPDPAQFSTWPTTT